MNDFFVFFSIKLSAGKYFPASGILYSFGLSAETHCPKFNGNAQYHAHFIGKCSYLFVSHLNASGHQHVPHREYRTLV